jgi:hypothetical protein
VPRRSLGGGGSFARCCAAGAWRAAFARCATASHAEALAAAGGFARFRCDDCGLDRLVPYSCKGRAVCASCGPSTLLRAVPSKVEGRRATNGGTRRAHGGPRVPGGAGAAVGLDVSASLALPAGVGSRPVSRRGPSTVLRAIPSKVEGWWVFPFGPCSVSCATWLTWLAWWTAGAVQSRSSSASAGR